MWGDARLSNLIFRDFEVVGRPRLGDGEHRRPAARPGWWVFADWALTDRLGVRAPPGFPSTRRTVAHWAAATGRSAAAFAYYELFAGLRFTVIMLRMGKLLADMGLVPPEFAYDNLISQALERLLESRRRQAGAGVSEEWSLPDVHDVISAAAPDREAVICGAVRRTRAEVTARTRGLAAFLVAHGLGAHRERHELERWECGQDIVALVMGNGAEYLESILGAFRARAVPANVNQHYGPTEVAALLQYLDARAVVYHRAHGPLLAKAAADGGFALTDLVLVDVDDGSGVPALEGSAPFEAAVATPVDVLPTPSPDDLYLVCTGGTTGVPKAVLWRQADIYVAGMAGQEGATEEAIAMLARGDSGRWFAVPPMMHAGVAVDRLLRPPPRRDRGAPRRLRAVRRPGGPRGGRAGAGGVAVDRRRRLRPADRRRAPSSPLRPRGAPHAGHGWGRHQRGAEGGAVELIPQVTIRDGYGASETGGMAFGARSRTERSEGFTPAAGAAVVSADRTRFLGPGEDEMGWTARRGRVPLGYLGDEERTEATFPIIDGARVAIPGDRGAAARPTARSSCWAATPWW